MKADLKAWNLDKSKEDPYRLPKSGKKTAGRSYLLLTLKTDLTLHKVRLMMAQEEKARVEAGTSLMHKVSWAAFIINATEIQTLQWVSRDF